MTKIFLDKLLILVACLTLAIPYGISTSLVVGLLSAILLSLISSLENLPWFVWAALIVVYCFLCIDFKEFLPFLPLISYDVLRDRKHPVWIAVASLLAIQLVNFFRAVSNPDNGAFADYTVLIIILLCGISILLYFRTTNIIELQNKVLLIQDEGKEQSILLESKNKELIENQNYEINVATLKERNRIAREIHDNVGHMLTRAILQTGALKVIEPDENIKEQIQSLNDTLNTAMNNIRTSVHDLHDESVDLKKSIEEIIDSFPKLKVSLQYDMEGSISNEKKYSFISIIKEALNNTAKHSNSEIVHIHINEHPAFYQLIVADEGTDIPESFTGGIGLSSIRERVKNMGGNLNITTDKGFKITITIMK